LNEGHDKQGNAWSEVMCLRQSELEFGNEFLVMV